MREPPEDEARRARELTRSLAGAALLPAGAHARDVGAYRALEFVVVRPGEYWATSDIVDGEGAGHLEVTVAYASTPHPVTLADIDPCPELYPGTTGEERLLPDGSLLTVSTTRSIEPEGGIFQRAILSRLDGTYVDVRSSNEDGRIGGYGRSTPPLDAETVLHALSDLRP